LNEPGEIGLGDVPLRAVVAAADELRPPIERVPGRRGKRPAAEIGVFPWIDETVVGNRRGQFPEQALARGRLGKQARGGGGQADAQQRSQAPAGRPADRPIVPPAAGW